MSNNLQSEIEDLQLSAGARAIIEGAKLAADLRAHEAGTEHRPTPHEQIWTTIQDGLAQGKRPVLTQFTTRGGQPQGGMIVVGDQAAFEQLAAFLQNQCLGSAPTLPGLEPTEEAK